jgi:Protein of unknown function (DUF559)
VGVNTWGVAAARFPQAVLALWAAGIGGRARGASLGPVESLLYSAVHSLGTVRDAPRRPSESPSRVEAATVRRTHRAAPAMPGCVPARFVAMRVTLPALGNVSVSTPEVSRMVQWVTVRQFSAAALVAAPRTAHAARAHANGVASLASTPRRPTRSYLPPASGLQGYIVDYYASAVRLIVEVDGAWHVPRAAADRRRDRVLTAAGYRIVRGSAERVLTSLPEVLTCIRAAVRG